MAFLVLRTQAPPGKLRGMVSGKVLIGEGDPPTPVGYPSPPLGHIPAHFVKEVIGPFKKVLDRCSFQRCQRVGLPA
jgi:hypothetical protein